MTDMTSSSRLLTNDPGVTITLLGGRSPVQGAGKIDGHDFYFQARDEHWSLGIGGDDVASNPAWHYEQEYGDGPFTAGWMTEAQAKDLILKGAALFRANPALILV